MAWRVELETSAEKDLAKIGHEPALRIVRFLLERVAPLDDPRSLGQALTGPKLGQFWKYRVGDYRIIANMDDGLMRILVVRIGHRRDVYKR